MDITQIQGIVSSIQRSAIHDGPGIRTVVFLKGCLLRCLWCASPEVQSFEPEVLFYPEHCLSCNRCIEVCPEKAIIVSCDGSRRVDRLRCNVCGTCAQSCYAEAMRIVGGRRTVPQVLKEVERDKVFYGNSGGGVTISGGEPLQQVDFTRALLQACKTAGIHTAMETSGYQSWNLIKTTLPYLDLLLFDVKQMDPEKHKRFTGVSNRVILSNLEKVLSTGVQTIIRVPVILGFNDDMENVTALCRFLNHCGKIKRVDLLPYHNLGEAMYRRLGRKYFLDDLEPMPEKELQTIAEIFCQKGLNVRIGG